jgi:gamma-glutamylcyclotransferase (GGCT)/AIG2-like uncharacterized protein YtfP
MSVLGWNYQGYDINSIADMQRHCPKVWGFVYKLTLRKKGTNIVEFEYRGKKNVYTKRQRKFGKKETAALADKRKKAYEYVIKEGDWKTYVSSNKFIKLNSSKFDIEREIVTFSTNDNDLTYQEAKAIICSDALENCRYLNDGVSIRRFGKKIID